ncbi:MAG: hypothetical protein R6V10_02185 [bacterium]
MAEDASGKTSPCRKVRFLLIPHTHRDREWYLPLEEFRYRLVRLLDRVMELIESEPEFRCFLLDGQSIILKDYLEIKPEGDKRLRGRGRPGIPINSIRWPETGPCASLTGAP